jgi:hypothetical protein
MIVDGLDFADSWGFGSGWGAYLLQERFKLLYLRGSMPA